MTAAPDLPADAEAARSRLYDAECALHAAHMAHLDAWIAAADTKLHQAIGAYFAATTPDGEGHRGRCSEVLFQSDEAVIRCPHPALPSSGLCLGHSLAAHRAGTLRLTDAAGHTTPETGTPCQQ